MFGYLTGSSGFLGAHGMLAHQHAPAIDGILTETNFWVCQWSIPNLFSVAVLRGQSAVVFYRVYPKVKEVTCYGI